MNENITTSDLNDLIRTGTDVQTTVYELGEATIRRSTKDDLSILTISGVYSRALAKEIEKLCLQWRGNMGLEFKDIKVNPQIQKKFDSSVIGLLKTLRDKYQQRKRLFMLCMPPPELVDLLKLTGAIEGYKILGQSSTSVLSTGAPDGLDPRPDGHEPKHPQHSLVQKRILNLNQSLKRTVSLEKGLDSAEKCVKRFLPQAPPVAEGYEFAFSYKSSEKVGGDFFDFIELGPDMLGIVIGDVSGHGIDAALLMGICKKVLQIRAKEIGNGSPKAVLCKANSDLVPDFHKYAFVTALYGILHLQTGRFTFARAGHEAPITFGPGPQQSCLSTRGMPLGVDTGKRLQLALEEQSVEILPGGFILFCTDGLAEARNDRGQVYSRQRLLFTIGQVRRSSTCREALETVLDSVSEFSAGRPYEDDVTAILLHRLDM